MDTRSNQRSWLRYLLLVIFVATAAMPAAAGPIYKADNTNALNLGSSWSGGTAPGATEVATWDNTVTGTNAAAIGDNVDWLGISILNPGGAVTIDATSGKTLTLRGSGIDMTSATQSLTVNADLNLGTYQQSWLVGSGQTLTVNGAISGPSFTGTLSLGGAGDGHINGAISMPSATIKKIDGGTWTLYTAGTWDKTVVGSGTLKMGGSNVLPSATVVTMGQGDANSATLDLNGWDQTVGGLALDSTGGTKQITSNAAWLTTLTVGGSAPSTYAGTLAGTNLKLAVTGTGALTLSGSSTYGGGTDIGAGATLKALVTGNSTTVTGTGVTTPAANNPLGSGAVTLAGGTLEINPLATVNQNGLSGRSFTAGINGADASQNDYTAAAAGTRWDANLNRYDLTTASGGGTAMNPQTTNVVAQWMGKLQITNPGSYRFFTASDDGSRIFIDGVLAVNNDGGKGTTNLGSAAISLSAGLHDIQVQWTQGTGDGSEILSWSGAAAGLDAPLAATPIPSTSLWTAESNTTAAGGQSNAVVVGAGSGNAVNVTANSTINLNGTMFTQAQMGAFTQNVGTTLNVTGLAGKTLRLAGAANFGNGAAGTITINHSANVAFDGAITDGGFAVTLAKQGGGRLIFDQTAVANTFGSTSLVDVQNGTLELVGGANNPIGTAGVQLSGGNVVLNSKSGARTFDNAVTVAENATIQDIVDNVTLTLGSGTRGISVATGKTLTLDAITGGNNTANNPTGTAYAGATLAVAGAITGAGNLNAISTSFGNNTTPGIITLTNAANTLSGNITLNGTTITTNTLLPVNGPTLRPTVFGALPNTATTALFIKSGTLDFATNNIAYTPNLSNVVTMGGGPTYTTSNINIGTGVLSLTNDIVYDATNNGGVATIRGNGAATGILDLNTAGQRTINVGDSSNAAIDLIVSAVINGTGGGGLTKTGVGTMAIQANVGSQSTGYTGLTRVSNGTLFVGGGSNFAGDGAIKGNIQVDSGATFKLSQSNIIINTSSIQADGTFDLNGLQETAGNITGSGTITSVVPNTGGLLLDMPTGGPTFTGALGGQLTVGFIGRLATGNITIPTSQFSALTYNGNTIIGDANSTFVNTLQISSNNALPFGFNKGDLTLVGTATAGRGGTLDLNGSNLTVNALIGAAATGNPIVTNNGATNSILTIGAGNTGNTFSGIIQDGTTNNVSLVKTGLGTQTLGGANTFTGNVTINNGQLAISNAAGLGTTAGTTTVNSGGYLTIANVSSAEPITLNGRGQPIAVTAGSPGATYTGALQGTGFTVASSLTGAVTLASNSAIGVPKGSLLTIASVISDGGSAFTLTKTQGDGTIIATNATSGGGGILKLTGASTYTGPTIIEGGSLWLGNTTGQAIQSTLVRIGNNRDGADLTLLASEQMVPGVTLDFGQRQGVGAKFQLNGFTQTVAAFANSDRSTPFIQNHENGAAATPGTLIVNNASDTSFYGGIRDLNGVLNVTKNGAGTLTFNGNGASGTGGATYTGPTSVTAGKLKLTDETAFNSPITLSGTGSLEFNYNFGRTLVYAKALTDNGLGFTKTGLGNLTLNTASTVTGTVNVNEGVLNLTDATGNVNPMPNAPINVAAGAQLQFFGVTAVTTSFNNNVTLNGLTPGGALSGAVVGGTPTNTLTGTLTLNSTSNISTGWSDKTFNISGKITGTGGLVFDKLFFTQNPGIFNLTNTTNDYAGGTTINTGTVQFTAGALPATGNLKFGGTFGNGGNFGTGQLVLSTTAGTTFTRNVGTGVGEVQFTGDGGGFTAIGAVSTVSFGNVGPINWSGTGTTGLDANASLVINTGTGANNEVNFTNDFNLNGGMRRVMVNTSNSRFSGVLSGSGGLIKDGGGQMFLSGAASNTYTGLTTVPLGTLTLAKTGGAIAVAGDIKVGGDSATNTRRIVYLNGNEQIADTAFMDFNSRTNNNGDLRLLDFDETLAGIIDRSGSGVIQVQESEGPAANGTVGSVLTINSSADSFYNGYMRDQGSGVHATIKLSLVKSGTGTLTISQGQQSGGGSQTYSGATTINGGKLVFNNIATYNSAVTVNATGTVEFDANLNQALTEGQVIAGTGNLIKGGQGAIILSNAANSYSGTTTVNGGILQITGAQTGTHLGTYIVNNGAGLLIGNGTTGGLLSNNNAITVNAGGTVAFNRNNAYNYSGVISGAGNVLGQAGGTATILSGANAYSGTTTLLQNATLTLAGNGASAGGLNINSGSTLTLDFNLAGANAAGIVAATAPVNLNGGTLAITGSAVANTQTLGPVTLGIALPGGLPGLNPGQPGLGASNINLTSGAGGLNVTLGPITHVTGATANIALPASGTVTTTGAAIGGIANGFTTTSTGTTWLAQDGGGVLTPLATYGADTYGTGINTDVVTGGAGGGTNSLRFNTAAATTVTLTGANTIDSGGILVTSTVAGNASTITGGTLSGTATTGLNIIQGNTGSFTIASGITDNGGATGLTKSGTGTTTLTGANTYSGATVVNQGTLITLGTTGGGTATALPGATLQIGNGTTNGILPTFGTNTGTVIIGNAAAQSLSTAFNAAPNFNFLTNAVSNGTSFQTGVFRKIGPGTLTITSPVLGSQFHQGQGTTVLDTGANVLVSSYNSIGQLTGDTATLTMKGASRLTQSNDFNVGDITGSNGVFNIQDAATLSTPNFFVGKSGTATGIFNQSGFSTVNVTGNTEHRVGGGGGAGDVNAYGSYKMTSGTFNHSSGNFQPGAYGYGVFTQEGGTSTFASWITPGRFTGGTGLMNVQGGTLTQNANRVIVGENSTGVLNVGVLASTVPQYSAGQLFLLGGLSSGNAGGTGNTNLWYGGLINAATFGDHNADTVNGTSTFNFHGGTIQARAATTTFFGGGAAGTFNGNFTNAFVYQEGAVVDSNSFAITIPQPLLAPAGNGLTTLTVGAGGSGYQAEPIVVISGGGGTGATARAIVSGGVVTGFQITNPGVNYTSMPTVTLVGGNPTSAATIGGIVIGANATTGGLTKVGTGVLTLTGTSTYGGATTITGGGIAEGFSTVGGANILPATGLVLNGGSLTATGFAAGTNTQTFSGTTISGVGAVTSTIGTGGTMAITLGAITRTSGGAANFAGTGTINTLTANTGGTILGGWATQGGGATWAVSAGTGAVAGDITGLAGGSYVANTWAAGNNTDMTAAGTVTNLTTNSVRFNTATPVTVTVSGTDTITTGGILVTPTATAAATIFTGGTLATGTNTDLIVNHFGTSTATITSVIAANGTGGLVKAGGGVLILGNVTNTYNGNTVIGAGTLRLGGANNVHIPNGAGKGDLIIGAGATLDLNGFDETINGLSGFGTVTSGINSNKTLTVGDNNVSSTFSGVFLNGSSTANVLTKTGTGTLTLNMLGGNTYTGNTNINNGAIKIATPNALANNTLVNVSVANGLLFDTTIPTISALGGNSNFALQTTATSPLPNTAVQLSVGANNNGGTFTGALTGSGALVKIGTGIQTLGGANTNAGGLYVNAGTLALSGNNSGAGGSVFANSGGTLQLNAANSLWGAAGRTIVVASNGIVTALAPTAQAGSASFGALTPLLSRIDQGSTGVLALQTDATLQAPVSENLNFSTDGLNLSLGSILNAPGNNSGFGNAPVQYTGVLTPNANTFRLGGGSGRLILPNSATMAGANDLFLYGGGSTGGLVFLTAPYTFTGSTTVNAGTTYITSLANAGSGSSLGAASTAASNLILNGGTLSYIGSGSSTDRLFTLSAAPTNLDSSGTGPVNFTNTGAVGFLNSGNRTFTLQGQNTGANTIAAAFGDSINIAGTNGTLANGITTLQKNGNGTWILSGANTFSGGVTINNGVLGFTNAGAIGANTVNGPASVLVNSGGAVALLGSLQSGIQATLNRVSPLSAGTVALTANTAEAINFDGGSAGASLPSAFLGAYGNVTYTGTLTPFANNYRLGGGGGTLTMPNGGLTGPRVVVIGGGGPGASFVNNPNLNGAVVLGGTSDYSGGTILSTGAVLSATNVAALGTGPLKFQGGFYRAIDTTDITLASDGTSAREIRIGFDSQTGATANVDVAPGVSVNFSKAFGMPVTLGSNLGQASFTKYGAGTLALANGINLGTSNGTNNVASNAGTIVIERGTLSILANPTNYVGTIQVGSNNGGVGTLQLGANNVFANTVAQYAAATVIDLYTGSKLDLNGFSDTIRNIRGFGSIVNTGAGSPTLTTGTVASENMIWGGNLEGSFVLKRVGNIPIPFGTGGNANGIELWNNYNPNFTGKFVADAGGLRFRADGTLGSTTGPLVADKITLDNGGTLFNTGNPLVLGANRGITIGSGGGTIWNHGNSPMVINGPISGPGMLTIADDPGTVMLASDSNTWSGGTTINSNNSARGYLSIGAGGATGSLPAGDVFFNSAAGAARLYLFKSTALNLPNNLNGPGYVLQIGAGTTTLSGTNNTGQTTFVGGGKLRADFSGGNAPIGTGTGLQVSAGTFEYVAPAGDNTLRLGTLTTSYFGMPYAYNSGCFSDAVVQSTYGGSGTQNLIFGGNSRPNVASTMNFVTSGGVNGVTNSIRFSAGPSVNNVIGAAFYFNGADFAAYDVGNFVRAANYGADANTAPLNTLITGRYSKLTTSLINQGPVQPAGIHLAGPNVNLTFANSGNTTTPFTMTGNPSAILKTGGGGLAGVSIVSGGTMAATINPQVTTPATLNTNGQELILRPVTADDYLQIDMPIAGGGTLQKSGLGQIILTGASTFTGQSLINAGSVLVTGNGVLGTATGGANLRIANAAGASATVTIDSATASIVTGNNANDTLRVGEGGAGVFNQSAGTVTAGQFVVLGENQGSSGLYNLTGGTLNVKQNNANQPQLVVGRTGTGTLNISGSSTVNVKNGAQIQLGVGTANPSNFGPNLVANAGLSTGVGTIAQTGGTVNVDTGNGTYQSQIYGGVILGVDGSGTYTLNGGTLNTPLLGRGHGTAAFNLGSAGAGVSGTLKATASTMNVTLPINLTGTGADRGTIHTNGNDLSFTGALTGAGGFKKDGAGVLNVLGTGSTYAGGTDIVTGSVVASGTSLGTGVVNVGGGATLTIQGVQSGLLGRWVNSQSTQANPGVSTGSAAMLTEFSSLANFDYFLAGKAALAVESTAARGKVSVNYLEGNANNGLGALPPAVAALTAHNNYFADLRGKFNAAVAGDYTFQTRSDDASVIWIDGQPVLDNNRAQAQTTRTGTINLTAGLHDIVIGYFEGGSGDGFTVGVTLPGQGQSFSIGNELNMSNDLLSYGSNNLAIGSLAGSGSVLLGAGTLTTGGDGTNAAFSGVISGSGSLVKIGGGVQTLSGANTYSGTTTVHGGGTLKVGAINALPVGTVLTLGEGVGNTLGTLDLNGFNQTIAGLTTAGTGTPQKVTNSALSGTATLTVNNDAATSNADYTFGGVIENGTATTALTKSGDKKLTLSGANTYTGATIVSGGQLRVTGSISTTNANGGATVSAATATLELAGAAGSATAAGLDISNSGTLLVSTLNQQVGDVAGTGTTNVQASSSLTANSIVQDTLIIGAGGSVTIREIPIAAGGAAGANAVPEPATWVLIGIGLLSLLAFRRRR